MKIDPVRKNLRLDLLAILILIIIILAFLWRGATMQGIFFGADTISSDLLNFSYPAREYWVDDYLKKAQIPLWNSYITSGTPFLAQAQTGIFNPLQILLYLILPLDVAFNWSIIISFCLISAGTYFYSKLIGLSKSAAFFSASVFSLSGFMVGHLRHIPVILSVSTMPFMFYACEKILKDYSGNPKFKVSKLFWPAIFALLVSYSIFGGHLSSTYLIVLFLIFYFILRVIFMNPSNIFQKVPVFLVFVFALILGITLSSVQILSSLELIPYSSRAAFTFQNSIDTQFYLKYFLLLLNPYIFGNPILGTWDILKDHYWENIGYIGILPLVLSLIGIIFSIKQKNKVIKTILLILGICVFLLLGQYSFIYKFFWDFVPGFNMTRIPGRFLLFVDFFLSILAGFGLLYIQLNTTKYLKKLLILGIITITIVDLFIFGINFNPVITPDYYKNSKTVDFLKKDNSLFRIKSSNSGSHWKKAWKISQGWQKDLSAYSATKEILAPDSNLYYRIQASGALNNSTGTFGLYRSINLDKSIISQITTENLVINKKIPKLGVLLGIENVKYFISEAKFNDSVLNDLGLTFLRKINTGKPDFDAYIYLNNKWLPRAYLVGKYTEFSSSDKLLGYLLSNTFDPSKEVLLENKINKPQTQGRGEVDITLYKDTRVEMDIRSQDGGILVLSDSYYPGWKAYVDGIETKIYLANYAYRAIYIEQGKHKVVFEYKAKAFQVGLVLSILSIIILVFLLILSKIKNI